MPSINANKSFKQKIIEIIFVIWNRLKQIYKQAIISLVAFFVSAVAQIKDFKFSDLAWWQWLIMFIGAIITALILYSFERKAIKEKLSDLDIQYELTFGFVALGLENLLAPTLAGKVDKDYCIEKMLTYIEKSIESILTENDIIPGSICVNLMVLDENVLHLTHFDLDRKNRNYITLPVVREDPAPGAVVALCNGKFEYIKNIRKSKYKVHFKDRPYKSIVSFPLVITNHDGKSKISYGVINVDSNLKNQFVSDAFIEKRILPAMDPFMSIFHILNNNGKIVPEISYTQRKAER